MVHVRSSFTKYSSLAQYTLPHENYPITILDFCESLQGEKSKYTSESVPMNFVRCFSTALLKQSKFCISKYQGPS